MDPGTWMWVPWWRVSGCGYKAPSPRWREKERGNAAGVKVHWPLGHILHCTHCTVLCTVLRPTPAQWVHPANHVHGAVVSGPAGGFRAKGGPERLGTRTCAHCVPVPPSSPPWPPTPLYRYTHMARLHRHPHDSASASIPVCASTSSQPDHTAPVCQRWRRLTSRTIRRLGAGVNSVLSTVGRVLVLGLSGV